MRTLALVMLIANYSYADGMPWESSKPDIAQAVRGIPVSWHHVMEPEKSGVPSVYLPGSRWFDAGQYIPLQQFRCPENQQASYIFSDRGPVLVVCSYEEYK